MKSTRYEQLLREFAKDCRLPDADMLVRTGLIRIGGMDMLLQHDEASEACFLRLDLGVPPASQRTGLWPALLASNFTHGGEAVYSLHPASRHVVLMTRLRLDEALTGREFKRLLLAASAHARRAWKQVLSSLQPAIDHPHTAQSQARIRILACHAADAANRKDAGQ